MNLSCGGCGCLCLGWTLGGRSGRRLLMGAEGEEEAVRNHHHHHRGEVEAVAAGEEDHCYYHLEAGEEEGAVAVVQVQTMGLRVVVREEVHQMYEMAAEVAQAVLQ